MRLNTHQARKSLGQHFLLDLNITRKIARSIPHLEDLNIIEIGPGPGGLSIALLQSGAKSVTAIEKDKRFVEGLQDLKKEYPFSIYEQDALKVDFTALCPAPRAVAANLPYNIAAPLLINCLKQMPSFESLTLMFQKEMALRLVAKPSTADYGRLSVITQYCTTPKLLFHLPPQVFTPPPKVTSSVVQFLPKPTTGSFSFEQMEQLTAKAFNPRRKMLKTNLKTWDPNIESYLQNAGLNPKARAQELSVSAFCHLADHLATIKAFD